MVKEKDEIPVDYEPRRGDVLKRSGDGSRFRIMAFTGDNKGIELEGIDQPIELYIARDQLRKKFIALVSREPSGVKPGVRITGGEFRGRGLAVPPGARPTEGRVREALFSIWSDRIEGARVLDLFAGSGVVGLEALGRGALSALAVDQNLRAVETLEANAGKLGERLLEIRRLTLPAGLARLQRRRLRPRLRRSALQLPALRGAPRSGRPPPRHRRRDRRRAHLPPRAAHRGRAADAGGREKVWGQRDQLLPAGTGVGFTGYSRSSIGDTPPDVPSNSSLILARAESSSGLILLVNHV